MAPLTHNSLIQAGYRRSDSEPGTNPWLNHATARYQRKIDGFFLNVFWYAPTEDIPGGWQLEASLRAAPAGFKVTLVPWEGMTVEGMERWFQNLYRVMHCTPIDG